MQGDTERLVPTELCQHGLYLLGTGAWIPLPPRDPPSPPKDPPRPRCVHSGILLPEAADLMDLTVCLRVRCPGTLKKKTFIGRTRNQDECRPKYTGSC